MSDQSQDPVELSYERILEETSGSIVFEIEGERHRIPKSQISEHDEEERTFEVPEWLAVKEGLV